MKYKNLIKKKKTARNVRKSVGKRKYQHLPNLTK
jgi:hypothetical protein